MLGNDAPVNEIATVTTLPARRSQLHTSALTAHVTAFSLQARAQLEGTRPALLAAG